MKNIRCSSAADIFLFPFIHFHVESWRCDMSRKKQFITNTALLTFSALMLRAAGMLFQGWLASRIGAEGIGLYQLSGSVTILFSVIAVSGVRFAATKLVSEEAASKYGNIHSIIKYCSVYAAAFGILAFGALWSLSEPLGFLWVEDARIVLSLRIASAALPFVALSAVFSGYFTALGRVWKMVLVQTISIAIGIVITILLLSRTNLTDLKTTCSIITFGNTTSEFLGFLLLLLFYLHELRQRKPIPMRKSNPAKRILSAALPLALSSYTRTGLNTLEHMMIPKGLRLSGLSAEAALSGYGMIHGMALPVVLFPACLLISLAELVVPELSHSQARGEIKRIHYIIHQCRRGTAIYAAVTAIMILILSDLIADQIFHTPECAKAIRSLAPLIPVMNLDTVTDGCLRGLGQQTRVMAINILDAAFGVLFVLLLLPGNGVKGYIQMIWITEIANFILSSYALKQSLRKIRASGSNAEGSDR